MTSPTLELAIPPDATELLRRHGAEAAFQASCELTREVFPDLLRWEVETLEDPDTEGRTWVGLRILLPRQTTGDTILKGMRELAGLQVERIPLPFLGEFGFHVSCDVEGE